MHDAFCNSLPFLQVNLLSIIFSRMPFYHHFPYSLPPVAGQKTGDSAQ